MRVLPSPKFDNFGLVSNNCSRSVAQCTPLTMIVLRETDRVEKRDVLAVYRLLVCIHFNYERSNKSKNLSNCTSHRLGVDINLYSSCMM